MVGFSFSWQISTQLKKFLRWRYFIPKVFLFFHQFHKSTEKYLCGLSCFKNSGSQAGKKNSNQHYGKIPDKKFKSWSTKYLELKIKNKSWYIHDFFEPVSYNASSTSPFNAIVIGYFDILIFWFLTFSLITVLAFHKDVSSIRISKLHTCVIFIIFFPVSKPKSDLIDKNLYWKSTSHLNQLTHGFVKVCPIKYLPLKIGNWSVYFSFVLGYIRFQQSHDNKKFWYSVTMLD